MDIKALYEIYKKSSGVSTDTRSTESNNLFFALKGSNFNGNVYAKQALTQGALHAIIDDESFAQPNTILVDDVLKTLQDLSSYHRQQFNIPVIGITGTNGKTTTKELIANVLKEKYVTHFTKGNLNNHIGVPVTLLEMSTDTEIVIIEMGANHVHEIEFLCKIVEPNFGIITNIGEAHVEGFGSLDNI